MRLVRRVGVIGDVHTESARLEGVLRYFGAEPLDALLCTGDVPDGPHDARAVDRCCVLLREAGVLTVLGNHDRWLQDGDVRDLRGATDREEVAPQTLRFLAALPATLELDTPAGLVLLCHGMGTDDMAGVQPFDHGLALEQNTALQAVLAEGRHRYAISGHTHRAMVRAIQNLTVINAGTLLTGQDPCCTIVDFQARKVWRHEVAQDGSVGPGSASEL